MFGFLNKRVDFASNYAAKFVSCHSMLNDFDYEDELEDVEDEVEAVSVPVKEEKPSARARTLSPKELLRIHKKNSLKVLDEDSTYPDDVERPKTREDCLKGGLNERRPCPFVSCEHHLYMDVNKETGAIKMNFPHLEVWELKETCALDVADRGGITLEEVGEIMNLTRERIRQVEVRGLSRAGFEHEIMTGCHDCNGELEEIENLDGTPGRVYGCVSCDREIKERL